MKHKRQKQEQFIRLLREHAAEVTIEGLPRKHEVAKSPLQSWKSKYGAMEV